MHMGINFSTSMKPTLSMEHFHSQILFNNILININLEHKRQNLPFSQIIMYYKMYGLSCIGKLKNRFNSPCNYT